MSTEAAGSGIRKPTDAQQDQMTVRRTQALDRMPYMAALLFNLRLVDAPGPGTFACDAKHRLYIDFDAVDADPATWTVDLCAEALLHECGHLLGNHSERRTDAGIPDEQASQFNVASDCEINDDLEEAGCKALAAFGITPKKINMPDYLTAEEYFEALQARQNQKRQQQGQSGWAGQSQPGRGQRPGELLSRPVDQDLLGGLLPVADTV